MPKCAMSNIGAAGSVLMATICSAVFIPAWNWIAPDMPQANMSRGLTVRPKGRSGGSAARSPPRRAGG